MKRIAILGSTGSIGTQALEVIEQHPEEFEVEVLTAHNNADLLIEQALKFNPNAVVISNEAKYKYVSEKLDPHFIKVFAGSQALAEIVEMDTIDMVLGALVGYSGLLPIVNAIIKGKAIALANKEVLVVAGQLVNKYSIEYQAPLIPVDSEHSAMFQCLTGELEFGNEPEKLILTASGGPFRGFSKEQLQNVTKAQALKHPNWDMGAKVTIDSATLMNKGLEMIEAKWLFGMEPDDIDVVVHPQSIVHSGIQFKDGSIKAQMGLPDMKLPIQYAMGYPKRLQSNFPRFSFFDYPELTFEKPDIHNFRNLALAYEAIKQNGNMPCIMNAANEVAVQAFLEERIGFFGISEIIEKTMRQISHIAEPQLDEYIQTHTEAIAFAKTLV